MSFNTKDFWNGYSDGITGEPSFGVMAVTGAQPALVNIRTEIHNPNDQHKFGHASINVKRDGDQRALYQWLHEYEQSRQDFQDEHVERANKLAKTSPAMAIIAARQVLEIPYRGHLNTLFSAGDGVWIRDIAQAYGIDYDDFSTHKKVDELHRKIFTIPGKTKESMSGIIKKSRAGLASTALESWRGAVEGYKEQNDQQATGMSYAELAKVFKEQGSENSTIDSLNSAMTSFVDRVKDFHTHRTTADTIELDELHYYLAHVVKSITTYGAKVSKLIDKDVFKSATYALDDYGENFDSIVSGYRYLSKALPLGKGKMFFGREVREMTDQKKLTDLLDAGRIVMGGRFRQDRRNVRP